MRELARIISEKLPAITFFDAVTKVRFCFIGEDLAVLDEGNVL